MDDVLWFCDKHFFTPYVYSESIPEDNALRQAASLFAVSLVGGYFTYLFFAYLSYVFIFDKALLKHPKMLPNQVQKEITMAVTSIPTMVLLTVPFFLLEVRGHTKLYDDIGSKSPEATLGLVFLFVLWNDCFVYWIHRALHHPKLYKRLHKDHHKWLVPTPFASHAFHPVDGWAQSVPYHMFILFFPLHKWIYMASFIVVNIWTISIHDACYAVPKFARGIINGAAHHTDHHLYFNYNLGLYFTFWDKLGGTFRNPSPFEGNGPYDHLKKLEAKSK